MLFIGLHTKGGQRSESSCYDKGTKEETMEQHGWKDRREGARLRLG